jgi:hypothetical protein
MLCHLLTSLNLPDPSFRVISSDSGLTHGGSSSPLPSPPDGGRGCSNGDDSDSRLTKLDAELKIGRFG